MKTALVHDWLTGMRGGEKVLERLAMMFPDAPIYTLFHHPESVSRALEQHPIHTSFLQAFPARQSYRWYLPLYPLAMRSLDLTEFDLVISSSHCAAKAAVSRSDAVHICYCHTPMRYAWDQFDTYFSPQRVGWLRHALIRPTMAYLRRWDRRTAARVDSFVANSGYVADRIRRHYTRQAEIIPSGAPPDDFYLMVTALSPYKRVDVAIEAFNRIGRELVIVGAGPEAARMRRLAGPTVRLAGRLSSVELADLYRRCRGFVLPGVEDAGIAPLEAMACGRPALVLATGGAHEAVIPGITGLHIPQPTPEALIKVVDSCEGLTFNTDVIRAHAESYSFDAFDRRISDFIDRTLDGARIHSVSDVS